MKVLAIDPSSSVTGYAVLTSPAGLVEAGKLRPARAKDAANVRIRAMGLELALILMQHQPDAVVIEDTSGKVGYRGKGRGMNGAGLAVHGKAVGYFMHLVEAESVRRAGAIRVACVPENEWTRGTPKAKRQKRVALMFPAYRADKDQGGDVADAIGLASWWIIEQKALNGGRAAPGRR